MNLIKKQLSDIIQSIDAGNSNPTESEALELTKVLQSYTDKTIRMSKYLACEYLNVSRATFDNYIREGLLPKGLKQAGFKELHWTKKSLDQFIKERKKRL